MERFIAGLVKDFEAGKITRRQFGEAVAFATVVYGYGNAAKAAPAKGLKMLGVNHISYSCADYAKVRDWYSSNLGMQVLNDNKKNRANLAFGPEPGKGGGFLVARNFGNVSPTPGPSQVDHVCYTIPSWNDQRLMTSLTAAGTKPVNRNPGGNSINVFDPNNYQVQLASIVGENAWRK